MILEWKGFHGQINLGNGLYFILLRKSQCGISNPWEVLEIILFNFFQSRISQINIPVTGFFLRGVIPFLNISLGTEFAAYVSECHLGNTAVWLYVPLGKKHISYQPENGRNAFSNHLKILPQLRIRSSEPKRLYKNQLFPSEE